MFTITFDEYTAVYNGKTLVSDHAPLEALVRGAAKTLPVLQETVTSEAVEFSWDRPYTVYQLTANILFDEFDISDWQVTGDYEWPQDSDETGVETFSQWQERRKADLKALLASRVELHLAGQHDQQSHGSWAQGEGDLDLSKEKLSWPLTEEEHKAAEGKAFWEGENKQYKGVQLYDMDDVARERISETMDLITSVHSVPEGISPAKVEVTSEDMGSAQGVYRPISNVIRVVDERDAFSFIHEYGHYISMTRGGLVDAPEPTAFLRQLGDKGLGEFWYRVTQSEAYKNIVRRMSSAVIEEHNKAYARYLADPREVFARAYAQWVAIRSRNARLYDQFSRARSIGDANDFQWNDTDFEPIAETLDEFFRAKGLR